MDFRVDRSVLRKLDGFPSEAEDEGYAECLAMSPEERIDMVGFLQRRYLRGILNLSEVPRVERVIRFCALGDDD